MILEMLPAPNILKLLRTIDSEVLNPSVALQLDKIISLPDKQAIEFISSSSACDFLRFFLNKSKNLASTAFFPPPGNIPPVLEDTDLKTSCAMNTGPI